MLQIWVPADFVAEHRRIVLDSLYRSHMFRSQEWRKMVAAIDRLKNAAVLLPSGRYPFPLVYRQQVEKHYADSFIKQLYQANQIERESITLWANVAKKIRPKLTQAGLLQPNVPESRLLLAYCLYWWRSFTLGYALEIEIQRDLAVSGIEFQAHDLRQRSTRLTPYDLLVSGFYGDINTSTYFLQAARTRSIAHDFYITRIHGQRRVRTLVVFIQDEMWKTIDGQTVMALLSKIVDTLPQATRITTHMGTELVVIEYELWKEKIRDYQAAEREE